MTSENGKTEEGGRNPPDASLYHIAKDLLAFLNGFDCLREAKKQVLGKITIKTLHGHWKADVIEEAFNITKLTDKKHQEHWAFVIMVQVMRSLICDECKQYPAQEESGVAAGGVNKQHSGGSRQTSSSGQKGGVSQSCTGTPNTVRSQSTGNNPADSNRHDRPAGALLHTQNNNCRETIYIRIPRFLMIHNEERRGERFGNIESHYKLIDGVPETENIFDDIMKKKSYVMSFNHQTRNANWVYEILNRDTTANNHVEPAPFGHNYHRGHLAAAANHRWCWEALDDADVIDNIVPQHRNLNTGPWLTLEDGCRRRATAQNNIRNVHVYSGPLYRRLMDPLMIQGKQVPSHFFKVIIEENVDGTVNQPQYYLFPNGNLRRDADRDLNEEILRANVEEHRRINHGTDNERDITIEDIQNATGLTFIVIRPNVGQNAMANEITVRLRGEDRNRTQRTAVIQVTISPLV
ncbi:uncharacterized protein LOC107722729 [Sinocyclocheilus rhinocerous]|uniref:uncharacterized protein LOC107722729 n=1 Tax=Sinocyclocheilus rhinocerous TaxID=307959 RepID=UPI0007B96F1F|nr:PREDICTED: uncharacterized protein LOC107722729 [Sinocyclocheilus rhinocerous]XP_016386688.1 PREDICTED: uncharacterized protein LOC107722729 [Sinocyclocheilus rhinocerous]XP_016386689.1 PREDICTED: uncharacterized protein LOC107722729 [Sinocyclocheilus rhinocerous]